MQRTYRKLFHVYDASPCNCVMSLAQRNLHYLKGGAGRKRPVRRKETYSVCREEFRNIKVHKT